MTVSLHDADLRSRQHQVLVDFDLLDVPADAELDAVTRIAATVAGTPYATINLLDSERQCQPSSAGFVGADSPRDESMCHLAARLHQRYVYLPDAAADPLFADNPWVDGRRFTVGLYASAPLVADGVPIGTLCAFDTSPGELSEVQLERLVDLAEVVVALLERRRAIRVGEAARQELVRANAELLASQAFERALLETLPMGVVAADADRRISLFNQVSRHWHGTDTDAGVAPEEMPTAYDLYEVDGTTPLGTDRIPLMRVYAEGRVTDAEIVIHPHGRAPRTVSCSGTTIRDAEGRSLGAVVAMADISAQRELEEQLRTAALHDPLTGLPNRTLLVDRLEHALVAAGRQRSSVAVLYCDLDGFKAVNDNFGHAAGDDVLAQAAVRLVDAVRPGDTVARIGGDEFVLVCPGVNSAVEAQTIADRVTGSMAEPLRSGDGEHQLGVSVGLAISRPGATSECLLTQADDAMYRVKRLRRTRARRS